MPGSASNAPIRTLMRAASCRVAAEDSGATSAAEPLLPAALRCPGAQRLLAREQAKRTSLGPGVGRGGGAAAPLTARAVAVVRCDQRSGHLESYGATRTAARQGEV